MVSYFFPPCGGGGVQRSSKFVKYLPRFYWKPYVLTVRERNLEKDLSLLKDIPPEAEIFETFSLEELFIRNSKKDFSEINLINHSRQNKIKKLRSKVFFRVKKFINKYVFQPDSAVLWFPFAMIYGVRIIKKYSIDLIYACGSPWTGLLIGAALKKITKKPLVVDLRDPWSMNADNKILDKYFEIFSFRLANSIIINTESMREAYGNKYSEYKSKMVVITNGYDNEDFIDLKSIESDKKKFRVVFSGSVQSPITFFKAVKDLLRERPEFKKRLEILFIGLPSKSLIYNNDLGEIIKIINYKPHDELLSYLINADLLLIILKPGTNNRWIIPGKVYEYFATKKPILAVVPEGNPLFGLVKLTGTGSVVEFNDINVIKHYLLKYIEGRLNYQPNIELISQFERKYLTAQLVEIFKNCVLENR